MPRPFNELTRYLYQILNPSENSPSSTATPTITAKVRSVENISLKENDKQTFCSDSFQS